MSTQLEETDTHFLVSTIQTLGRERRRPRNTVQVPKNNPAAVKSEIIKQVKAARVRAGLPPK